MTTFTFVGCSLTVGIGLEHEKDDPNNYTNLVANHYKAQVKNLAVGGNSNYNIFISALTEILFSKSDILFVQWSALNRLWVYPGPNTQLFLSSYIKFDYAYRDLFFSKKELQQLANAYHLLNHDYHNIIELINYSNILESVARDKTKIVFINGLIPWTKEICDLSTTMNYATKLSKYTKEILDFNTRDDVELDEFFTNLHLAVNSLQSDKWVNMFDSLNDNAVDTGNDNLHPGPKSHHLFANKIINYLTK